MTYGIADTAHDVRGSRFGAAFGKVIFQVAQHGLDTGAGRAVPIHALFQFAA